MLEQTIFALLPILVTILLGMWAARHGDFDSHDSQKIIKLVMNYALPLSVFAGIWGTKRETIIADLPLLYWILGGFVISYILVSLWHTIVLKKPSNVSALRALSVADCSVPFVGSVILPLLFGAEFSALSIGISTLVINIILLPIVFAAMVTGNKKEGAPAKVSIGTRLKKSLTKPIVVAALLGFVLSLIGVPMPLVLKPIFTTLGGTSGGLAMFAAGIVLFDRKVRFTFPVAVTVVAKNLIFPLIVWGLMSLAHVPQELTRVVVVTCAIPTSTMPTTISIDYNLPDTASEMASIQFWSVCLSFITISFLMIMI